MQKNILINKVNVPVIELDGKEYYPISHVFSKVLLRNTSSKGSKLPYDIKKLSIKFGECNIQECNCVDVETLKIILNKSHLGRLSSEQKIALNGARSYFGLELIDTQERFIDKLPHDYIKNNFNNFQQKIINKVVKDNPNITYQKCTKCNKYYPYDIACFDPNVNSNGYLSTICRECLGTGIKFKDDEFYEIYKNFGVEMYNAYHNHDTIKIYEHWIKSKYKKTIPQIIHNTKDYKIIIKWMFDQCAFENCQEYNTKSVSKICNINCSKIITTAEIQQLLFGHKLVGSQRFIDNVADFKIVFFKCFNENYPNMTDVYSIPFYTILRTAKLTGALERLFNNDILYMAMELFDNKYAAYRFKIQAVKYWKNKDNRIQAMKYFIEEDMKIPLEKVPLYVTLTSIRSFPNTSTLYGVCKNYYKSLFEWIDEVYPDRFDPKDFDINYYRNDFDSVEEQQIHDILNSKLKNVMYNARNTDRTITLANKFPDWFVFTDYNIYVIEYFGITNEQGAYNSRIKDYQEKTTNKINAYSQLSNYKFIYLYPDDLKNNFENLLFKIESIICEQNL